MSGGLQPDPTKYEHVVADACCPMKLALVDGVPELWMFCTVLELITPAPTVLLVRLRLPFGESVIDLSSEADDGDADGAAPRAPGVTT
jgi:hypothetical protein